MSITPQNWLCFASPLEEEGVKNFASGTSDDAIFLYRTLLEQNERMFMAKFALDQENTPLLMVEMALKDTHPLLPYWSIESLARYKAGRPLQQHGLAKQQPTSVIEREFATAETLTDVASITPNVYRVKLSTTPQPSQQAIAGVADDTVLLYLKGIQRLKWRIKDKPKDFSWHLGYRGHYREFDVYLTSSRTWMYIQVPVLIERTASVLTMPIQEKDAQQQRALFLQYLLRLNHSWYMAKLAVSTDDQILLLLEMPVETLDFSLFRHAVRTLGTYLDRFEQEIQIMASLQHNQRLFEFLSR